MKTFQLQNEPQRPKRETFESTGGKQRMLFSGLDCLPAQKDLFATDGPQQQKAATMQTAIQQYNDAKAASGEALLLFRVGDFYELFHDDARVASKALGLTLTTRNASGESISMAGFPCHQLDVYLGKLVADGYRVAVCEPAETINDLGD